MTSKSNGLENKFQFENYIEKPSKQISEIDDTTNTLSSTYDNLKYI